MSEHIEQPVVPVEETKEQSFSIHQSTPLAASQGFEHKLAGFWIRFWAYLIDLMIIGAIGGLLVKPIFRIASWPITDPVFVLYSPYKLVMLVVLLTYFLLMTKFLSQTIGKMIMGIQVVKKTGEPLGWGALVFREVIGRYISKTLVIPYLLVIFMPRKEALHDLFADTEVIHEQVYEKTVSSPRISNPESRQLQGEQSI